MYSIRRGLKPHLLLCAWVLALIGGGLGLAGCEKQARSAQQESVATKGAAPVATASAPALTASQAVDYQRAVYDPLHFKPAIEHASDAQCLACHQEVLQASVRQHGVAGNAAADALAWYQQTSTYAGPQETFHRRHLVTALATKLMRLRCTTCHEGNEPRDEAPGTSASSLNGDLVLRKMVNPQTVCLRCHGKMNWPVMGLPAAWEQSRATFQNNCLICHAAVRTNRHQVNYLNAQAIEQAGAKSGDACFGCHGGRAWYRLNFPYPRHAWSAMPAEVPDWAKTRSTQSEARFLTGMNAQKESTP